MPLMALKKICGSCFKHGCSTISWGRLLEFRNCSWNLGVVLTIAGLLKSTGLLYKKRKKNQKRIHWLMEQYIYIQHVALSLTFNISNCVLTEGWWQYRNRSTMASIDFDLCSLYVDHLEVEQEKENVDSWTVVREKTLTWDANMYLCMYLFASTHI